MYSDNVYDQSSAIIVTENVNTESQFDKKESLLRESEQINDSEQLFDILSHVNNVGSLSRQLTEAQRRNTELDAKIFSKGYQDRERQNIFRN